MNSNLGMGGNLDAKKIRGPKENKQKVRAFKIPFIGRVVLFTKDPGTAILPGEYYFMTDLQATHLDGDGKIKNVYEYGSGLTTNVGVLAMANDFAWAAPSGAAINTLKLANWHATGTGTVADAATDIKLGTPSGFGGQNPIAGAQTLVSVANVQKYRSVATIAYTGTEAVTEWGLFSSSTLSATTGTPFTAGSATTGTVTGTPLTASSATVQGQQQNIFEDTAAGSLSWGLVLTNTTSVITVPAWYKVSDGTAGTAPVNTDAYVIRPVMWDRRKFAAINVVSGDSIQFTYSLTINSGT